MIAIDGKTLRRSFDKANRKAAIPRVSAWCETNNLVLGQLVSDAKSNKITAIPRLLKMLDLRDVTFGEDQCRVRTGTVCTRRRAEAHHFEPCLGRRENDRPRHRVLRTLDQEVVSPAEICSLSTRPTHRDVSHGSPVQEQCSTTFARPVDFKACILGTERIRRRALWCDFLIRVGVPS